MLRWIRCVLAAAAPLTGQQVCAPTPTYSPCEIVFELDDREAAAHPNPYLSVELRAELRSPRAKTILMPAFWDGGRRMVIRFAPVDPGTWDFRISGNLERFNGKLGQVQATESAGQGFLRPANVHHWRYTESLKPHLWMGDSFPEMAGAPQPVFDALVEARAKQKFNHLRGLVLGAGADAKRAFPAPDQPSVAWFQQLDQRILALNRNGIFADLILAENPQQLIELFGGWQHRERFLRYIASRYSAFHLTWQIFSEFESHEDGRALLKELGALLKKYDPYQHPRSTGTKATSAPGLGDGWMNFVIHHSADDALGAIEHQLFPAPFVNTGFAGEQTADAGNVRKRLWNCAMNGQYPSAILDARQPASESAKAMTIWHDFFAKTRYWELEPYFDVDGGRAVALPGVEYIVYIEKPGPVEILVERHSYDVFWFNPVTGESMKEKKDFKGERFTAEPPSKAHEWVLHLSREGRKEGMLRSYKFESRPILMQEVEQNPLKLPFEIEAPAQDVLTLTKPAPYGVKLKRETRGTRHMMYLWTGEVPTEGRGYRVLGTGASGTLTIPPNLAKLFPAVFNIRLYAMNAVGKVYSLDRVCRLTQ